MAGSWPSGCSAAGDGRFDVLFMAEPGLKAALAQLRGYAGLRLQLRSLEPGDIASR